MFALGHNQIDLPRLTRWIGYVRCLYIFSGFLQIVVYVAGFSDGDQIGGNCIDSRKIPYLFDALEYLQGFNMVIFLTEKVCCLRERSNKDT